jgi:DNA polymerase III sliding clamp (beta) subunit (PCNA family)/exonuclease VII small subunit
MNIEIEIPVPELKALLPGLSKIISRSARLPVLQCIKVSLNPNERTIELQAHNLEEIATARLPNNASGLSGQMLVPLEILSKIVKGCGATQSVRVVGTKQETKVRYSLAGSFIDRVVPHIPVEEWPEVKAIKCEPVELDDAFKVAVWEALSCASEDSSRYVINGACLDTRDKEAHYVVGTDGRHLYSANSFRFNLPEPLIIPTGKFVTWPGFMNDGPWKLRMLPGVKVDPNDKKADKSKEAPPWLQIDSNHWSYVARAIDGQYPNWKQVVPTVDAKWTQIVLEPSAAKDLLAVIPLLPGGDTLNRTIVLDVATDGLALKGQGAEQKDCTRIPVPGARIIGKSVQVALNRDYLLRALRFGFNEFSIQDSLNPVVFTSRAKIMVVMPVRLEGPPAAPAPAEGVTAPQPISPPEKTPAAPPSAPGFENVTEQRNANMQTTTMTAPERGNLRATGNSNNGQEESAANRTGFKAALEHVERIKTNLRDVIADLSDAVALLKTAEKEQRATVKEIEAVRAKLRDIQSVEI